MSLLGVLIFQCHYSLSFSLRSYSAKTSQNLLFKVTSGPCFLVKEYCWYQFSAHFKIWFSSLRYLAPKRSASPCIWFFVSCKGYEFFYLLFEVWNIYAKFFQVDLFFCRIRTPYPSCTSLCSSGNEDACLIDNFSLGFPWSSNIFCGKKLRIGL